MIACCPGKPGRAGNFVNSEKYVTIVKSFEVPPKVQCLLQLAYRRKAEDNTV